MKRPHPPLLLTTTTPQGVAFFELEEAVELLCHSCPSPPLVATLLRLSKKTRRQVWDFLSVPHNRTMKWIEDFCGALWHYRELRPKISVEYFDLHPTFIPPTSRFPDPAYSVGKFLVDATRVKHGDALIAGSFRYHRREQNLPNWAMARNAEMNMFFEWYFVASALALAVDRIVVHNSMTRRLHGEINVPHDAHLCLL